MTQCFVHLVCMLLLPKALRKYITPDGPHSMHSMQSTRHRAPAANGPAEDSHRAPAAHSPAVNSPPDSNHMGVAANMPANSSPATDSSLDSNYMAAIANSPASNSLAVKSPPDSNHVGAAANSPASHLPAKDQHQPQQQTASSTRGEEVNGQGGALSLITWGPTVLCDMAAVPQIWWPLVSCPYGVLHSSCCWCLCLAL